MFIAEVSVTALGRIFFLPAACADRPAYTLMWESTLFRNDFYLCAKKKERKKCTYTELVMAQIIAVPPVRRIKKEKWRLADASYDGT